MRTSRTGWSIAGAATASLIAAGLPGAGWAQASTSQVFSIREQSLDAALKTLARQTGREIMYPADLLAGRTTKPLAGRMTVDEAIRSLLRGTGLEADFRGDVVLIRGRSDAPVSEHEPPDMDVVVTGTRIRGGDAVTRTRTVGREAAVAEGISDLGALARALPENFSGGQNPGVVSSDQKGAENVNGSTSLNLRGLGADATLTLINGHRVAYDGANQGVDISAIPLIAIDRVEILPDGSSALYGSDAVAGVANVILRRDYEGLLTSARLAAPTRGGGFQVQTSALAGGRWSTGGAMAAFDFVHANAIDAGDRSFTTGLDPSATLSPFQRQFSGVILAHQRLADGVEVGVDAQGLSRSIATALPFFSDVDARTSGNIAARKVQSYSVSPSITGDLGAWQFKVAGTHGTSTTTADVAVYSGGAQVVSARVRYEDSLDSAEIGAEGPLFRLGGGAARIAIGAGWREVSLRGLGEGVYFGVPRRVIDVTDSRDVFFGFGEASLPFVGPQNARPGLFALQLDGAVRYEHYRTFGGVATPRLALRYDPVRGLSLRGSWGRSFKAPTLFQANQFPDGSLLPTGYFNPEPDTDLPVLVLAGGGQALGPERARTWTAGVVIEPMPDRDLTLEATYFNLRYRDRVLSPIIDDQGVFGTRMYDDLVIRSPTAAQVEALVATLPTGLSNQTDETFNPAAVYAIVDERLQNVASQDVQGVDVSLHAGLPLGDRDKLLLDTTVSYLESDQRRSAGQRPVQRAGTIFDPPHWRGRAALGWARETVSITGALTYIGGTLDDRFAPFVRVDSFTSFDLTASIKPQARRGPLVGVELLVSATNLLDKAPSRIRTTSETDTPYDSTNYPSIGRVLSIGVSKKW